MMKPVVMFFVVAFVLAVSASVDARTWYVPSECPTIQAGIDSAVAGDTVLVADGTYTGPGNKNLSFGGKAITVRSENGPENCVIDCDGYPHRGFNFDSGETGTSVVDGFTIQNGRASYGGGVRCGYGSSPRITNCTISGNSAYYNGGGVSCYGNDAEFTNCTISGNSADDNGGGIKCKNSSPTFTNCVISDNSTNGVGGGVFCWDSSSPTFTNCTFSSNSADDNAGGVGCWSSSSPTITNCILWGNQPQEIYIYSGDVAATYSDIQGGWPGDGNIDADPLFFDPGNDDYHLSAGSPCIDAGDNTAVPPGVTTDLDGNPRIVDGNGECPVTVDMGAYEFQLDAECQVSPTSLNFGIVTVGDYLDTTFNIVNTGEAALCGTVTVSCEHYSIVSGGGVYNLGPGDSVTVTVRFEPNSPGQHNCAIETGSALCSDVSCTGFGQEVGLHDVAVTNVVPSDSVVGQGDTTSVDVTVENRGDSTETFYVTAYYDGIIFNGDFEVDTTGTSYSDITDWDYQIVVHQGNPPTGDDLEIVDDYYFKGEKSLYFYLQTTSVSPFPGNNIVSQYLSTEEPVSTTADYVSLRMTGDGYTTSSRYSWHIALILTDGDYTYEEKLRCDCWGNNEGCTPNHFDYYDATETGADGRTWKRYTSSIPGSLDKSNLTVKVKHYQASWDLTQASSWYRLDCIYFSDSEGNPYGLIETKTVTDLLPGQQTTPSFTWNTTDVTPGDYTISAYAHPLPDELDTDDNTYVDGIVTIFLCGDCNGDGIINVGDVVYLVSYLYKNGPAPSPIDAGDCNCDDIVNVGDVVYLVSYLYKNGPPPGCP